MVMVWLWLLTAGCALPCALSQNPLWVTDQPKVIQRGDNTTDCSSLEEWQLTVQEKGLGLAIMVNETYLDSDNGDYIVVSADRLLNGSVSSVVYITGNTSDLMLAMPLDRKAFIIFYSNGTCDSNFTITVKQYGEVLPEPPPAIPNPYPPTGFSTSIVIYLAGKTLDEFLDESFLLDFTTFIRNAAYNFTVEEDIEGFDSSKPVNETVFLTKFQTCSKKWEDFETCVEAQMAVYVTKPKTEYELTVTHLEKFWEQLAKDGLPDHLGVQPYEFPDLTGDIFWWILWIFIAIFVTLAAGFVIWRIQNRSANRKREQRLADQQKQPNDPLNTQGDFRWPAMTRMSQHQIVPGIMLNNSDDVSVRSLPGTTSTTTIPTAITPLKSALKLTPMTEATTSLSPLHSPKSENTFAFYSNPAIMIEEEGDEEDDDEVEIASF